MSTPEDNTLYRATDFIDGLIEEDNDIASGLKERYLVAFYYLSMPNAFFFSLFYFYYGIYEGAMALLVPVLFGPLMLIIRGVKGNFYAANYLIISTASALVVLSYYTGGIQAPAFLWITAAPFVASLLLKWQSVLTWIFITIILIVFLGYWEYNNALPTMYLDSLPIPFKVLSFIGLSVFLISFTILQNFARGTLLKESKKLLKEGQRNESLAVFAQMTAGIAHEINNPLTVMKGNVKQLRSYLKPEKEIDREKMVEKLNKIDLSILRTSKIISGMKNLVRDGSEDEAAQFTVGDIVEETLSFIRGNFDKRGIALEVDYEEFKDITLFAQRIPVGQVLLNLISNAFDELAKVDERWLKVLVSKQNYNILIQVIDSGPGIPVELIEKIFHPFFTTKEVGKGTGLGLSLSHTIMQKNGGDLYIDTKNPHTCFVMELPISKL